MRIGMLRENPFVGRVANLSRSGRGQSAEPVDNLFGAGGYQNFAAGFKEEIDALPPGLPVSSRNVPCCRARC
jgi:hypothetical protein